MEGYFYLGKILKLFASKGALQIYLDVDDPEDYTELESVFVKMNEQLIPFFIDDLELRQKKTAVVTFADVDNVDQASMLTGCELYLPLNQLPELTGNRFYYHEVKGFELIDQNHGLVGILDDVLEYPHQDVFRCIHKSGKEILIPVSDEIITGLNRDSKQIFIQAPEGLIELYLE